MAETTSSDSIAATAGGGLSEKIAHPAAHDEHGTGFVFMFSVMPVSF